MAFALNPRANPLQILHLLLSVLVYTVIYWLWQNTLTHNDSPIAILTLIGILGIIVLRSSLPVVAWVWWGLGLFTLVYSLTPGQTMATSLWETLYLAAFAATSFLQKTPTTLFWILNIGIFGYSLFSSLSLNFFGIAQYFSGSIHYLTGAQSLILIPFFWIYALRTSRWAWLAGLGLGLSVYAVLLSGARAVYLPFVLVILLLVIRSWWATRQTMRIAGIITAISLGILGLNTLLPGNFLADAIGSKTSLERQTSDFQAAGSFGSRLQMWKQTLDIALKRPQGTGNGSFRDTLAAYQEFPTVLFATPHNYYLETLSTGGWLRLVALVGLLGLVWYRGWRTEAWPYVLGSLGLWLTLGFDITGTYPQVMMLAFATLGLIYRYIPQPQTIGFSRLSALGALVVSILGIWWFWPCHNDCAIKQKQGFRPAVLTEASELPVLEQKVFLQGAAQLNPQSIWVYRAMLNNTKVPSERLDLLQIVNRKFPLYSPNYYLEQAQLSYQLGQTELAKQTLEQGLKVFPPDLNPAGVPFFNDSNAKIYKAWLDGANALKAKLQ